VTAAKRDTAAVSHGVFAPRFGTSAVLLLLAGLALPVATVFAFIGADTQGLWVHLANTVLAAYVVNTLILVAGVLAVTLVTGVGTAWLVTMYAFPLRRTLELALVLPLAMPAYILAYAYTDLLQVTGPVQNALREAMGWGVRDYWFPDVRSLEGAVLVLGAALYPYIYLVARAAFLEQSMSAVEVSRTLGLSRFGAFLAVAVPMARPAIVAGATLVAMETLADFGAVKYFDLEVFTTGIYRAWFAYGNPAAAAQLASILLSVVFAVVVIEQLSRGARRYAQTSASLRDLRPWRLRGWRAGAATTACAIPVAIGFAVPVAVLVAMTVDVSHELNVARLLALTANTGLLAVTAAAVVVVLAVLVSFVAGRGPSAARQMARFTYLGYATPGVVAGVGLLIVAGAVDQGFRGAGGTGLMLSGSVAVLIYAYVVRFFAVGHGPIDAAFVKLGPRYNEAARTLGLGPASVLWRVDTPLMRGTLMAAAALVFVDVMKELPATMILRPFNFDTLATEAFQLATTERLDQAALPSLAIAAAGLIPVILLCLGMRRARGGMPAVLEGGL
jgi:iron(III) transport system permease protein